MVEQKDFRTTRQIVAEEGSRQSASLTVLVVIALGVVLWLLRGVLIPLTIAFFLSFLAMPVVRLGSRIRVPVGVSLLMVILILGVVLIALGQVVFTSGDRFLDQLPMLLEDFRAQIIWLLQLFELTDVEIEDIIPKGTLDYSHVKSLMAHVPGTGSFALTGVDTLLSGLSFGILILLFMVFIVLDRGHGSFERRLISAFTRPGRDDVEGILTEINDRIERYILAKTGVSLLTGVLTTVTLALFGIQYALMFGVVTFLLNYIPNIGSIIATIPPAILAIVTLTGGEAAALIVVLCTIQFTIGNLLEPVILGKSMQLNPITVLIALVLWGVLWGVWGMLMAVPLTAVIKTIIDRSTGGHATSTLMSAS